MGLDTVELVASWETEFSINIPDRIACTLVTPEDAGRVVESLLRESGRPLDRSAIDAVIRSTTLFISGLNPGKYRMDGRFVEDFGLD